MASAGTPAWRRARARCRAKAGETRPSPEAAAKPSEGRVWAMLFSPVPVPPASGHREWVDLPVNYAGAFIARYV